MVTVSSRDFSSLRQVVLSEGILSQTVAAGLGVAYRRIVPSIKLRLSRTSHVAFTTISIHG